MLPPEDPSESEFLRYDYRTSCRPPVIGSLLNRPSVYFSPRCSSTSSSHCLSSSSLYRGLFFSLKEHASISFPLIDYYEGDFNFSYLLLAEPARHVEFDRTLIGRPPLSRSCRSPML